MTLVLSPMEPGNRRIVVDGAEVGHALTWWSDHGPNHQCWQAFLWHVAGNGRDGWQDGPRELRLRELRTALEKRLAEGPWWK